MAQPTVRQTSYLPTSATTLHQRRYDARPAVDGILRAVSGEVGDARLRALMGNQVWARIVQKVLDPSDIAGHVADLGFDVAQVGPSTVREQMVAAYQAGGLTAAKAVFLSAASEHLGDLHPEDRTQILAALMDLKL
jgi:hypothetical protein